jgi:hypothetical protein
LPQLARQQHNWLRRPTSSSSGRRPISTG